MPVEVVKKNGKDYFRWGKSGKLYPTKKKAERQGRIERRKNTNGT